MDSGNITAVVKKRAKNQGIMCTKGIRSRVSVDTLDQPSFCILIDIQKKILIAAQLTSQSILSQHSINISVDSQLRVD